MLLFPACYRCCTQAAWWVTRGLQLRILQPLLCNSARHSSQRERDTCYAAVAVTPPGSPDHQIASYPLGLSSLPPRLVGCIHETGAVLAGATRIATETRNYGDGNYSLRRPLVPSQQSQSLHLAAIAVANRSRRRGDSGVGRSALAWGARLQDSPAAWSRGAPWESLGARRSIWTPKG